MDLRVATWIRLNLIRTGLELTSDFHWNQVNQRPSQSPRWSVAKSGGPTNLGVLGQQVRGEELGPFGPDDVDAVGVDRQEASLGAAPPADDVFDVSGDGLGQRVKDRTPVLNSLAKMILVDL